MKQKYSEAFIEQAVVKLLSRGKRTVREVALDLNVSYHTAKNWMKRGSANKAGMSLGKDKRPRTGVPRNSCWPCKKPMSFQAKPCRRGVVKKACLPIT